MKRSTSMLIVVGACTGGTGEPSSPFDVEATWRVRCEAPDEPCDYPVRQVVKTIGVDPVDGRSGSCDLFDGILNVAVTWTAETGPGYAMGLYLGYDLATGFDLPSQCVVNVVEVDGRLWTAECLDAPPSPQFPCQVEAPALVAGALSLRLRCDGMESVPFQAGREANLGGGANPSAPINVVFSRCDL